MHSKFSILVVAGEIIKPCNFFKSLKQKNKKPLILIGSLKLVELQMKKLKLKKIKILNTEKFLNEKLDNKYINLIDIKYNQKNAFENISSKSNKYIKNC